LLHGASRRESQDFPTRIADIGTFNHFRSEAVMNSANIRCAKERGLGTTWAGTLKRKLRRDRPNTSAVEDNVLGKK